MPNWVKNKMHVVGDEKEIAKFKKFVKSEESYFDFEKIIPKPKALNLVSGSSTKPSMAVYIGYVDSDEDRREEFISKYGAIALQNLVKDYPIQLWYRDLKTMVYGKDHGVVYDCETSPGGFQDYIDYGREYVTCLLEYGATDWYDWNIHNWGTKWNACEAELVEDSTDELMYEFETAWAAPDGIYRKLAKKFKKLAIHVQYADEDLGNNCGEYFLQDGLFSHEEPDEDPLEFACDVWEYDYREILAEQDELDGEIA